MGPLIHKLKGTRALIVGTSYMAKEYAKVMRGLGWDFSLVGRNPETLRMAVDRENAIAGYELSKLRPSDVSKYDIIIIAVTPESLGHVLELMIGCGARLILLEKPGALESESMARLGLAVDKVGAFVRVAYNRRYYSSVQALSSIIEAEKPVSCFFEFTEWTDTIEKLDKSPYVKKRLAIANSIHVLDTVNYLLGSFQEIQAKVFDQGAISWHPDGSTFTGLAICGATPVSYSSSWLCPGRWDIQVMTRLGRYKLSPMEKLQVQLQETLLYQEVPIDCSLDLEFKPGLYNMVVDFAAAALGISDRSTCRLPSASENATLLESVENICGYKK